MIGSDYRRVSTQKDLLENLADFCRVLRLEGFPVELSSLLFAAEGLKRVDSTDPDLFRFTLASSLARTKEQWERFQELFKEFWLGRSSSQKESQAEPGHGEEGGKFSFPGSEQRERPQGEPLYKTRLPIRYSPDSLPSPSEPVINPPEPSSQHREAVRSLLKALALKPSRRLQVSGRGVRFSLRRTLRRSLQYGGDLLYLELMAPRIKRPRLVLVCDVSGSMDEHFKLMLEFAHTLLKLERSAEVFLFSTDIVRVTWHLRNRDPEQFLLEIPRIMPQWGAGTRIGRCLKNFRQGFGSKLLTRQPVVAIYSDGWDQGEIELLKTEMEFLRRSSKALIWLNPLAGSPGYEPTCKGMAAALPFLDLFLPLGSLQDLLRLAKEVRRLMA